MTGGCGISYEITLKWMQLDLTDAQSTLVQVMAWCCQATSHYLSQCLPRSMSPNGITGPQWVKISLKWVPENSTDDNSTLVQVMAWCHKATGHYLSQCWSRSMSRCRMWHASRAPCPIPCKYTFIVRSHKVSNLIIFFKLILWIDILSTFYETGYRWVSATEPHWL